MDICTKLIYLSSGFTVLFLSIATPTYTHIPTVDTQTLRRMYTLTDQNKKTILHKLIDANLTNKFLPFLEKGSALGTIYDEYGNNLLHYALIHKAWDIAVGLIQYNCVDLYEKNKLGHTALDYARAWADQKLTNL